MEQGEFRHARHTALLLTGHIISTCAAEPNAKCMICGAAAKAMRNCGVQVLYLSARFGDFSRIDLCSEKQDKSNIIF